MDPHQVVADLLREVMDPHQAVVDLHQEVMDPHQVVVDFHQEVIEDLLQETMEDHTIRLTVIMVMVLQVSHPIPNPDSRPEQQQHHWCPVGAGGSYHLLYEA